MLLRPLDQPDASHVPVLILPLEVATGLVHVAGEVLAVGDAVEVADLVRDALEHAEEKLARCGCWRCAAPSLAVKRRMVTRQGVDPNCECNGGVCVCVCV